MTINFLNIIQVLIAMALIGFILIQRGPGATAGSAFGGGGGASGTVFGAKGSGSFLTKTTAILATAFFIVTMLIAIDASNSFSAGQDDGQDLGVMGTLNADDAKPVVIPTDGEAANTGLPAAGDVVEQAANEVEVDAATDQLATDAAEAVDQTVTDAQDALNEAATEAEATVDGVVEEVKEAAEEAVSEDGGSQ